MTNEKKSRSFSHWVDLGLTIGALACFAVYGIQAYRIGRRITSGPRLGELAEGDAQRKALGSTQFVHITPREPLYNRDVIWVQDSPWAKVQFNDKSTLRIRRGSLLVLTRSLKPGNLGSKIDLIQGEVELETYWLWPWERSDYEISSKGKKIEVGPKQRKVEVKTDDTPESGGQQSLLALDTPPSPSVSDSPSPEPSASPEPSMQPTSVQYHEEMRVSGHPKPGSILIKSSGGTQAEVQFAWRGPVTGVLEVTGEGTPTQVVSLQNQTSIKTTLKLDQTYKWQVKYSSGGPALYGPFEFKLYSGATHPLSSLIGGTAQSTIEMIQ